MRICESFSTIGFEFLFRKLKYIFVIYFTFITLLKYILNHF